MRALQFCDALLVFVAFWLADELRPYIVSFLTDGTKAQIGLREILWILLVVIPATPFSLELFGFYKNMMRKRRVTSLRQISQSIIVVGGLVAMIYLFAKFPPSSRFVLVSGFAITSILLYFRALLARRALRKSALEEGRKERVAIAGSKEDIHNLLEKMPHWVTDYWNVIQHFELGVDTEEEMEKVLTEESIQRVIIASRTTVFREISRLVELCEKQGIEAWVSANFIRTQVSRPTFDNLGGQPMLVLKATPELSWTLLAKSIIDRTGAFLFILFTSPLWVMAMIGIRFTSPGAPIFFCQNRAGKYGKPFKMWKFRTMVPDAESKLAEIKKTEGNEMSGPVFKLENDPRVFPFAKFLRKWSIDELPQMINVLTGDMSLVGPRPLPVYEVKEFEKSEHRRRLSVKPGITCTWQVGGRNTITEWEDWVKMDLAYIDNWSLWLDMKLLVMTVPAVLFGRGAK